VTRRRNPREPHVPDPITGLVDRRLIGARCRGKAPLFDDQLEDETPVDRSARLAYAVNICRGCPVQSACRVAASEHDAHGIWAGHLHNPAGTPGRPRKATA